MAGGVGTRLYPATFAVNKQLLPVYDKPMIYYSITTLMLSKVRDICIISTADDLGRFWKLLGDGSQWGVCFSYLEQKVPMGVAQAFILGRSFINNNPSTLILGDNIFYGHDLQSPLLNACEHTSGATVFAYRVKDPERYGVIEFDSHGSPLNLEEKPEKYISNFAVVGLYFYDNQVCDIADTIKPSSRGELEISSINKAYLASNQLRVEVLRRGFAWLDMGTHDSLLEAGQFISTIERRQGTKVACPEEVAFRAGWIDAEQVNRLADGMGAVAYASYLKLLLKET